MNEGKISLKIFQNQVKKKQYWGYPNKNIEVIMGWPWDIRRPFWGTV